MNITVDNIFLIGSILLFISVIAGKTSFRYGIPTLLLFLGIGILAGSEGLLGINFNDPSIAQFIGIVSLNFILFSGGLETNWNYVRPVLWRGIALSTMGVLITTVCLGVFVSLVTDFSLYEGLLLGAIVSSTDAAAVFSILRSKNLALKNNLRPTLELESGSNDPMAYVLTIGLLSIVMNPDQSLWSLVPLFLQQMIFGAALGLAMGKLSTFIINKIKLDFEGLYPVLVITLMFFTFSATDFVGGNGFLAVYLCAVFIGNQEIIHKRTIIKMFDGFAWLMQIVLFLTLGLLVFPSQIMPIIGIGIVISFFLILVARPVSVFISLLPFKIKLRNRLYISIVGLRGAVPIVFATFPLIAGIDKAGMIFNIVFFISVTSVILQGTTLNYFAKILHVALPARLKPKSQIDILLSEQLSSSLFEVNVSSSSFGIDKKIVDLNLPITALIALIKRNNRYIIPKGSTVIHKDDILIIISNNPSDVEKVKACLDPKFAS